MQYSYTFRKIKWCEKVQKEDRKLHFNSCPSPSRRPLLGFGVVPAGKTKQKISTHLYTFLIQPKYLQVWKILF